MKLKLDENGNVVVKDGMPVYEDDKGKEIIHDAPKLLFKVTSLAEEKDRHFETANKLQQKLELFKGIDPEKAKEAMTVAEKIKGKEMIESGEFEKLKAQMQEIADELNTSRNIVKMDLRVVTHQLLKSGLIDVSVVLVRSMARLEVLQKYAWERLRGLAKNQSGGKLIEEIRKCVEAQAKMMGAGEMNTQNYRVKSVVANLSKKEIDEIVNASANEFDPLRQLQQERGDILEIVKAAQPD